MRKLTKITEVKSCGVYAIKNNLDGKLYIGSSIRIHKRLNGHRSALRAGSHHNVHLQRAWVRDGELSFSFFVLEETTPELVVQKEQFWLDHFDCSNTGYNFSPTAQSPLGCRHTQEFKDKMSKAKKGVKKLESTKETMREARILVHGYGKSKHKGIAWDYRKKRWEARIKPSRQGKAIYLGKFASQDEAAMNYDFYAIKFYGADNCHLNFPNHDYSNFTPRKSI